jgi:nicotinamidase-related amidase
MSTYFATMFFLVHFLGWNNISTTNSFTQKSMIIEIEGRHRILNNEGEFTILTKQHHWKSSETSVIICDMWNEHWCKGATLRVKELAPYINNFIKKARALGMFIVHAPSGVVDFYSDHPARKRAQNAPKATNLPPDIIQWNHGIISEEKKDWPIDQSDGGCDCIPKCKQGQPWKRQIASIEIKTDDAISDSGEEIWNLFELKQIQNVILVGVHTNMCVIGRPFGLRNMTKFGKNVVLVRDLTDTMYNSRMFPYVNHFLGTKLIIEYIEKYICPTITSTEITAEPAFKFKRDN